jgi:uncharacterized protein YbaR (Trm112 family)
VIRPELIELLRCPETHQKLSLAAPGVVEKLNARIAGGQLRNRAGQVIEKPLEGALLCEDGTWAYPVRGNLPIMLVDEAIPTAAAQVDSN